MVTLVGIKLFFVSMQIILSTSEINNEIEQIETFVATKTPYCVTSRHLYYIRNTHALLTYLSEHYNGHMPSL